MKTNKIIDFLNKLIPNPICELIYEKDYEFLIAIVLSAQSTDKRVNSVTPKLFNKYSSLKLLKEADIFELENIIKPVGSYHKKAYYIKEIARIIDEEYNGIVPTNREKLITLPGVGRKTINVFLSEYYHIPAIAVDTHVERVAKRLALAKQDDDVLTVEKKLQKKFDKSLWSRLHLQLVLFGRYYCKAIKPQCQNCELIDICKYKKNKEL